ncbi:hypothetical protein CDAR_93901 [Caerostris darwini]|uniref:Uncharacterized protein n=1 Tax=Caerostris darwini TaxID=1538125 RepID=A0AAV4NJX0_9ARAC|nr:hypothetical protein CDAR_93901 [Caerostris darwini]
MFRRIRDSQREPFAVACDWGGLSRHRTWSRANFKFSPFAAIKANPSSSKFLNLLMTAIKSCLSSKLITIALTIVAITSLKRGGEFQLKEQPLQSEWALQSTYLTVDCKNGVQLKQF